MDQLLSVDEVSAQVGLGRTKVYEELRTCRLRSVKVGRRRLVPASAVAAWIADLATGFDE